eukprot:1397951-Pleurochrysis_carterae.AAC.1
MTTSCHRAHQGVSRTTVNIACSQARAWVATEADPAHDTCFAAGGTGSEIGSKCISEDKRPSRPTSSRSFASAALKLLKSPSARLF